MQVVRFEVDFAIDNEIVDSEDLKSRLIGLIQDQICDKTIIGNVVSKNIIYTNGNVTNQSPFGTHTKSIWQEPYPIDKPYKPTKIMYNQSAEEEVECGEVRVNGRLDAGCDKYKTAIEKVNKGL